MADTLRIHGTVFSPPTRAVMIFCKLHNIPNELIQVDLLKHEQKSPEFLAINPYGQVPAITHGTFSLGESNAIIYYLAEAFHTDSQWFPADLQARARVNASLHWHHTNTVKAISPYVYNYIVLPKFFNKPVPPPEKVAEWSAALESFLTSIDAVFANGSYIARTAQPTFADILLYCALSQLELSNFDFSRHANLVRWREEIGGIEAVREVHEPVRQAIAKWNAESQNAQAQ
ncbi:unnamed protein product [Blepharisma stoltei]|uniref:Glutathione S-transferase n=1 Tax=Blepharisma stoltei TaxID=1481888 RepID=A0AAU9JWF1_9CILI|nr:unnamed protein product [Blepharisma stoltei]